MKTLAAHRSIALISLHSHARLRGGYSVLALSLALCAGGLADSAYHVYQQHRIGYTVQLAGQEGDMAPSYSALVDAEDIAHRLADCPETEQEKGEAVLILDQDGKLVDTIR